MNQLITVTETENSGPPWAHVQHALVELWSFRCEGCRTIAPLVARLAREDSEISVFKMNVDECPRYTSLLGVAMLPALVELLFGEVQRQWTGNWVLADVQRATSRRDTGS
jgi:thiol-disulfide isomerase/thioredoxin